MTQEWDQTRIQSYVDDCIEENQNLEYKAAEALSGTDDKKIKITKHVSAMANAAGGIIIYGVKEYDQPDKRHLPETIDGIDRTQFSKEWLEHVTSTIEPRIEQLKIIPVPLDTGANHVAYVVEIPQSTTAHQARDFKYYQRYNFESVPMRDHQIRDVMNRATTPNVSVEFGFKIVGKADPIDFERQRGWVEYLLTILITNLSNLVVNHVQLEFSFPGLLNHSQQTEETGTAQITQRSEGRAGQVPATHHFSWRHATVLFPKQEINVDNTLALYYRINDDIYYQLNQGDYKVSWTLYADHMPPKEGQVPVSELHNF